MVSSDKDKLTDMSGRIAQAKSARVRPQKHLDDHHSQTQQGWRMVTELVAGLVIGFAIGYGLDTGFNTTPLFIILFTLLGFAAGIRVMLKTAKEFEAPPSIPPNERQKRGE